MGQRGYVPENIEYLQLLWRNLIIITLYRQFEMILDLKILSRIADI